MQYAIKEAVVPYAEADLLPLSGLQHLVFCERQCALIHLEQAWRENRLTAEGRVLHERADTAASESRRDIRIGRGIHVRSRRLGLAGRADVVEFRRVGATEKGARLPWSRGPLEAVPGGIQARTVQTDRIAIGFSSALRRSAWRKCFRFRSLSARCSTVRFVGAKKSPSTRTCAISRSGPRADFTTSWRVARRRSSIANRSAVVCSLFNVCLPPRKRARRSVGRYLEDAVTKAPG